MTPETVEISILPGYWSIIAIIVMTCILLCIPLFGFLIEKRKSSIR